VDTIRRIDSTKLPFLKTLMVESTGLSDELIGQVLSETANDRIHAKSSAIRVYLQVSIDDRSVLVCNLEWILRVSKSHRSNRDQYKISDITATFPFSVTFRMAELIISEANRLNGLVIDEGAFEHDS